MKRPHVNLTQNFGILVHTKGKTVLKQFDDKLEVDAFCAKLATFAGVDYDILERKERGIAGRATSPAFVPVRASNVPGGVYYKCIPVRYVPGKLFCTHCHEHTRFVKKVFEHGLDMVVCEHCDTADSDFYVMTANALWEDFSTKASN